MKKYEFIEVDYARIERGVFLSCYMKALEDEVGEMDDLKLFQQLTDLMEHVRHVHLQFLMHLQDKLKKNKYKPAMVVDLGFLCRESESLLDDWRKDCKAREKLASKILALEVGKRMINDVKAGDVIRGELARAKCQVKPRVKLPKKGSPEFLEIMVHLGVPKELYDPEHVATPMVKPDFSGLSDYVETQMAAGKKLPSGLKDTFDEYVTTYTKTAKSDGP